MAINPAAYEPWKRRRLAAGMPLSAIEAMRPKPASAPGYAPPSQSFNYPSSPMASAPGESFAPPGTGMSLKNDVIDMGEMLPGMQSQGFSTQAATENAAFTNPKKLFEGTLDQVRGGKPPSPFENAPGIFQGGGPPVPPGATAPGVIPGIPPGALANPFDPKLPTRKIASPLWR